MLTALFQPLLERILERTGWYDTPTSALTIAMNWIENIVGVTAFPWVAASILGLAAGVWADTMLRRFDGRHPIGKVAQAKALAGSLEYLATRIDHATREPYPSTGQYPGLFSESEIAATKLAKLGISVPQNDGASAGEVLRRLSALLKFVSPLLREGQIEKAQRMVNQLNDPSS